MAAFPNFQVKENEFYELRNIPPTFNHPHPELRGFKIIMVSKVTPVGNGQALFVCKWPSMESLAYYFKENLCVLPNFDEECTMTVDDAFFLLQRHIDPVELCLVYGRHKSSWLDNQQLEILNAAMNLIEVERTHVRLDQLYVLDCSALPEQFRKRYVGVSRIALLIRVAEGKNELRGTVQMRVPTQESLEAFLSSESLLMPDFNRVIELNPFSIGICRMRVLPIGLCFQLRKHRDFWMSGAKETNRSHSFKEILRTVPNFGVKENEFYEICNHPTDIHPHPELRGFKIIMVSKAMALGNGRTEFVCKWPSMESLTRFFKENLSALPTFDKECTMTEFGTMFLQLRHIDPVNLCLVYGRHQSTWMDNQRVETLNAEMNLIGVDRMQEVERTHLRPDQLYAIDISGFVQSDQDQHVGFSRIVLVTEVNEDPNVPLPVHARVPTPASLEAFLSSESLLMPEFDQVLNFNHATVSLYQMRVLPIELCFQLRKRPDFWIIGNDP